MTRQEAIDKVRAAHNGCDFEPKDITDDCRIISEKAIATILNAVVKGELVPKHEPRKAILNRYVMQNGHTKEQRPDESREAYNMRVYGLREEDIE